MLTKGIYVSVCFDRYTEILCSINNGRGDGRDRVLRTGGLSRRLGAQLRARVLHPPHMGCRCHSSGSKKPSHFLRCYRQIGSQGIFQFQGDYVKSRSSATFWFRIQYKFSSLILDYCNNPKSIISIIKICIHRHLLLLLSFFYLTDLTFGAEIQNTHFLLYTSLVNYLAFSLHLLLNWND